VLMTSNRFHASGCRPETATARLVSLEEIFSPVAVVSTVTGVSRSP